MRMLPSSFEVRGMALNSRIIRSCHVLFAF
jgi:hypothetical protein